MVAEELCRFYNRTDRVRVVFNAVRPPELSAEQRAEARRQARRELGIAENDIVFLCPAMNFELKGVRPAIDAFARFRGQRDAAPAKLVILGREMPEPYQRAASMLGVARDVLFRPAVQDMAPLYALADAVVLLSWYDPCSRVVLEAATWELPSITTACNGAAEILADGAGIVVESPTDRRAVAEAFARLCDGAARAERPRPAGGSRRGWISGGTWMS